MTTITNNVGNAELQRQLRRMIELRTLTRAAAELGLGREALLRYLADVDLQAGTRALIESTLAGLVRTNDLTT